MKLIHIFQIMNFWLATSCRRAGSYQHFSAVCCLLLHLRRLRCLFPPGSPFKNYVRIFTLKMEADCLSETLVATYMTTWFH